VRRFLEIEPAGRAGFVAVRFLARGAYLFFDRPLSEVAAGVVDLKDVWRDHASEWTERISAARDMEARVCFIERALLSLFRENGRTDPAVDHGLQLIEASGGQIRVRELAAAIGVSTRHLTRQFQRAVGLSPKEFGRISRFLSSVRLLAEGSHRSLMDVALASGFYDQATSTTSSVSLRA